MEPPWDSKRREGKMFSRMQCDRCNAQFHFTESPRLTRVPRCPACGSTGAHAFAA